MFKDLHIDSGLGPVHMTPEQLTTPGQSLPRVSVTRALQNTGVAL